jgi:hypothetical protein
VTNAVITFTYTVPAVQLGRWITAKRSTYTIKNRIQSTQSWNADVYHTREDMFNYPLSFATFLTTSAEWLQYIRHKIPRTPHFAQSLYWFTSYDARNKWLLFSPKHKETGLYIWGAENVLNMKIERLSRNVGKELQLLAA